MKTLLGWVGALSGIALLNSILFYATLAMGMPTVIGGLGWLLDHPTLGNPLLQLVLCGGSIFLIGKYYNDEDEAGFNQSDVY